MTEFFIGIGGFFGALFLISIVVYLVELFDTLNEINDNLKKLNRRKK